MIAILLMLMFGDDLSDQLVKVKRVYVDRLTGGETAAQMRDLIITALQNSKLFVITENQERADAFVRGAAEDLIYTDLFKSSENVSMRTNSSDSEGVGTDSRFNGASSGINSRSARSMGTIRLVNKDGDVLWSTTQESNGAKFHGASADVADKIAKQLIAEYERVRKITK
jgi:hypothetical protein